MRNAANAACAKLRASITVTVSPASAHSRASVAPENPAPTANTASLRLHIAEGRMNLRG